ncbi:hypothetical protein CR513_55410, partial [Mucuna pruriens]
MLELVHCALGTEASYNILTTSYPTTSSTLCKSLTFMLFNHYCCHYLDIGSKVIEVLLDGEHGGKVAALGICCLDTSYTNPNQILFRQVEMKSGEVQCAIPSLFVNATERHLLKTWHQTELRDGKELN